MRRLKGSGTIETRPNGLFRARFGRKDVGHFRTKEEAALRLDACLSDLGEYTPTSAPTLEALAKRALDVREAEGYRSIYDDRNRYKNYIATWDLISCAADQISKGDVRRWLQDLAAMKRPAGKNKGNQKATLSEQTRRNALNLLRSIFSYGLDLGVVQTNPCQDVKVKRQGTTRDTSTFLTAEEALKLIAVSQAPEVALAICTGLRSSELSSLHWTDVKTDFIIVRYGSPGKSPKNGKIRRVPLLPGVKDVLNSIPRFEPRAGDRDEGLVFPTRDGRFRQKGYLVNQDKWTEWLKRAGLTRRVRFHDLRHTCATLLLNGAFGRSWSLEEVKEMLGHSSITVTERYAKAIGSRAETAVKEMHAMQTPPSSERSSPNKPQTVFADSADSSIISSSRLRELNSRPTVYEVDIDLSISKYLDPIWGLAGDYLAAIDRNDATAHRFAVRLADQVLLLKETLDQKEEKKAEAK